MGEVELAGATAGWSPLLALPICLILWAAPLGACAPGSASVDEAAAGSTDDSSDAQVGSTSLALGETTDGFPSWHEQAVLVWTNRARADPAADLASCTVCAEKACYSPVPPLVWNHNLGRAARFHSENLTRSGCGLQHASPCTVVSDIDVQYTPGPCNGDPSCACVSGTLSCGSSGTSWSSRVSLFGTSPSAENIASGPADPTGVFYLWLHEPDSNAACGWRSANGHRANILGGSRALGVGKALTSSRYTQDFASAGSPDRIVSGVHYPETGTSLDFRANWFAGAAPTTAMVSVEGACHPMTVERGTSTNGTYLASVSGVGAGCQRYVFHFTDASGDVFYPSTGSYGIGCSGGLWQPTRPAPCGACTPDCSGRTCGDDGCGGSCGACTGGLSCGASGSCVCTGTLCSGSCIDTSADPSNCGGCGVTCGASENCVGGACRCAPDCSGRACGDDGCGGACGTCASDRTCDAAGSCECTAGTECAGACVDTDTDDRNCGRCGNRCRGRDFCVAGVCGATCTPDCTGRVCGNDGCGGSCGACGAGMTCDAAGACVCVGGATDCGGTCVDPNTDPAHCGSCGAACPSGESCVAGACTAACIPDCAGKACGDDGCGGSCGSCRAGSSCDSAGACICDAGTTDCGGTCVDTSTAANNCGACGNRCTASETCSGGACTCVASCAGRACGSDGCGGTCGTCAAEEVCSGGACFCGSGLTDCGGTCVEVRTDVAHCGSCGSACASGESCLGGSCVGAGVDAGCEADCAGRTCGGDGCGGDCGACDTTEVCGAGGVCLCSAETTDCSGACVDTRIDGAHCGACDSACAPGQRCIGAICEGTPTTDGGVDGGGPTPDSGTGSPDAGVDSSVRPPDDTGGCGCSVRGEGQPSAPVLWLGLLVGFFFRRTRR